MQNLILSPIHVDELVNRIANEIETRQINRQQLPPPPEPHRLKGDKAAAEYLGCTPLTVFKLRKSLDIPHHRYGRKFYYITTELDDAFKVNARKFGRGKKIAL